MDAIQVGKKWTLGGISFGGSVPPNARNVWVKWQKYVRRAEHYRKTAVRWTVSESYPVTDGGLLFSLLATTTSTFLLYFLITTNF